VVNAIVRVRTGNGHHVIIGRVKLVEHMVPTGGAGGNGGRRGGVRAGVKQGPADRVAEVDHRRGVDEGKALDTHVPRERLRGLKRQQADAERQQRVEFFHRAIEDNFCERRRYGKA